MAELETETHIINSNADTKGELAAVADQLYEAMDYNGAIKLYTDMLIYSMDSDLYVKLGNCFEKIGKNQTAIEYWLKAVDIDPMNSNAYLNLGNYYYKHSKIEKSIGFWMASLVSMPEEPTTNLNLAVAYTLKERPIQAYLFYDKYLKYAQDKNSPKYKEINEKIEKNKKLASNYLKLGFQYQTKADKMSALKCYQRAVKYYPAYSKIHLNLGTLYYTDKNYDEAIRYWSYAEMLDPNYPKIISNLAISYDLSQKYDYAYCYYTKYSNFIANKPDELERILSRIHKIKSLLNSTPYLITRHLDMAKEAFANCDYFKAINEYTNYIYLNPNEYTKYSDLVNKIESYIYPERAIIDMCLNSGKKLMAKQEFKKARDYFGRVLVLAESGTQGYEEAKRKFAICLQRA